MGLHIGAFHVAVKYQSVICVRLSDSGVLDVREELQEQQCARFGAEQGATALIKGFNSIREEE